MFKSKRVLVAKGNAGRALSFRPSLPRNAPSSRILKGELTNIGTATLRECTKLEDEYTRIGC